ncbi:MAG TPA: hypothetical protein VGK56_08755, partial [Anaerolineales bacterium]
MPRHPRAAISRITIYVLLLSLLLSCSPEAPTPALFTATPPPPTTEVPPTDASLPAATPTVVPTVPPALGRAQYTLDLQLNYSAKAASVNETILYPNWSGETLTNLVLAVQPNLWSGGFSLKSIAVDNQPITSYTLENLSQRLEIQLPQPIPPSGTATITINYGLILPQMQAYENASNDIRPQIYGYSERQVNLVEWYPFVVPYISGQGWVLHNPWYYGEHLVYDLADFDVTVTFTDGASPIVAASGAEVGGGNVTTGATPTVAPGEVVSRRFVLQAGRTFALSM